MKKPKTADPAAKFIYEEYINSSRWERRKVLYYARHPKVCRACGASEQIHLHHHTYKRLGVEHDDDLIPLCQEHHNAVHRLHRASSGMTLTQATKYVVGGPLHPPRKRVKPKRAKRKTSHRPARAACKVQPAPRPPLSEFAVGDRVLIVNPEKRLSWANGKEGTVRTQLSGLSWQVELDGHPGSRLAVTGRVMRSLS